MHESEAKGTKGQVSADEVERGAPLASPGLFADETAPGDVVALEDAAAHAPSVAPAVMDPVERALEGAGAAPTEPQLGNSPQLSGLFEGVEVEEVSAKALGPAAGLPAVAPPPLQDDRPWPAAVPGQEVALQLLTGAAEPDELQRGVIRELLGSLSDVETAALWGHSLPVDGEPLRNALLMRFRLAVAVATKPVAGRPVSNPALDDLIAATDLVLSTLAAPEGADQAVLEAISATRAAVARDAVAVAEAGRDAVAAVAKAAADVATEKYAKVQERAAKLRSYSVMTAERRGGRPKALPIAFGVMMAVGVLFHGGRMVLSRPEPSTSTPMTGLPAGLAGTKDTVAGVAVIRTQDGRKMDPSTFQQLQQKAQAEGKTVQQLGPNQAIVLPAGIPQPPGVGMEATNGPPGSP